MKKVLLTILLSLILNAFEVYDFYSIGKTGEFKFILKKYEEDKLVQTDSFTIIVSNVEDGRLIQLKKKGKIDVEFVVDQYNIPVAGYAFIKDKRIKIKDENIKRRNETKLISKKDATIEINGKKYSATKYTYKEESSHSLANGNLFLLTEIETTYEIYKDIHGIPIKIEETKIIKEKTKNILEPKKIIKETKKFLKEIVEIE